MKCIRFFAWKGGLFILALLIIFSAEISAKPPAPDLRVVQPLYGSSSGMYLKWTPVDGAEVYQFCRKIGVSECTNDGQWKAFGEIIKDEDMFCYKDLFETTQGQTYTYQVRAIVNGTEGVPSKPQSNTIAKIWPVTKTSDCASDESVALYNGFNQVYGLPALMGKWFIIHHEGIDIRGEVHTEGECVRAPMGGELVEPEFPGKDDNWAIDVRVFLDGQPYIMRFGHLGGKRKRLQIGTSIKPGTFLGSITSTVWDREENHTHIDLEKEYLEENIPKNPLEAWDRDEYRDPQGNRPTVENTNSDPAKVRFRDGKVQFIWEEEMAYLPDDGKVYGPVDIVVEATDHQSPEAPWQPPLKIGYYIQKIDGEDVVRSANSPYLLVENSKPLFLDTDSGEEIIKRELTLYDLHDSLREDLTKEESSALWFTYIVTNTTGTEGIPEDLDANQCWATDAKAVPGLPPNGYQDGYETAAINKDAKFPDGKYLVRIRLEDYVHTVSLEEADELDHKHEVIVDNFLPFIERVTVTSGGETIYDAGWMFSAEDEQLDWIYYTEPKDPTPGEALQIQVTTSETMHDKVKVTLTGQTVTLSSSDHQSMVWEGTIVPSASDDYTLTIQGHDMADNQILAFSGTQPSAFSAQRPKPVPKRTASGDWPPDYEALRQDVNGDTMHQLGALPPPPIWSITTPIVSMCEENLDTGGVVCTIDDGSVEGNVDVKASVALHPKDNLSAISVLLDSADTPGRTHTGTYWMPQDGLELVVTPQTDWFLCAPEISEERPCPEWPEDAPGYQAPPADSTGTSTLGWHVTAQEDQQTDTCQVVITWDAEETPSITLDLQPASVCDGIQEDSGTLEATAICTWAVKDRTDYVWWEEGIVEESSTYEISLLKYEGCNLMFRVYYGCLDNSGWRKDPDSPHVFKTHDDLIQPDEPGFEPVQLMEVRYENCQWSDDEPVCIWRDCQDGPCHIPLYVSRAFSTAFVRQYRSSVICDKTDTSFHWGGNSLCQYEKTPGTMVIDPASPGQVEIPLGP